MKKVLSMLLALALCASLLPGIAGAEEDGEEESVSDEQEYWWEDGYGYLLLEYVISKEEAMASLPKSIPLHREDGTIAVIPVTWELDSEYADDYIVDYAFEAIPGAEVPEGTHFYLLAEMQTENGSEGGATLLGSGLALTESQIQSKIDELYSLLGGTYFNVGHSYSSCDPCEKKGADNHSCSNCLTANIFNASWFKNIFGTVSTSNIPTHQGYANGKYVTNYRNGWSCYGFANFAEWYIFKNSSGSCVDVKTIGYYSFNYDSISKNARIGDILRLDNRHSVIFISYNSNEINVLDCNYVGSYHCKVEKHTISYSSYSSCVISREEHQSGPVSYVSIGDDFYAVILNTACWKPISQIENSTKIFLETEVGSSRQIWHFTRQEDGAYVVRSCYDGHALEMYDGIREANTQICAQNEFWGGAYQQWFLLPCGDGYIFQSKHYFDENWVMELYNSSSNDGNQIQINHRNNSSAQIWSVYAGDDVQLKPINLLVTTGSSATKTTFSWSRTYGVSSYNLKIKNRDTGDEYSAETVETGHEMALPAGNYMAFVEAVNYFKKTTSNTVYFSINNVSVVVTFDRNGGSGSMASKSVTHGSTYTLPSCAFTPPAGKQFKAWSINGTEYAPGASITVNGNITVTAVWKNLPASITSATRDGSELYVSVTVDSGVNAKAICAMYDSSGRMLGTEMRTLTGGTEAGLYFTVNAKAATAKIFVVDKNTFVPLCESKTVKLK